MLLRQPCVEAACDGHGPGLDRFECSTERTHEPLSAKALANAIHGESRVTSLLPPHTNAVAIGSFHARGVDVADRHDALELPDFASL